MYIDPLLKSNPHGGINTGRYTNLPYFLWSYTFNVTMLDIIDKCHDRRNDLKILSLPEIQPILIGSYSKYENNWSGTKVDVIYSGYEKYETENFFYCKNDLYNHLTPNKHFFTLYFLIFASSLTKSLYSGFVGSHIFIALYLSSFMLGH